MFSLMNLANRAVIALEKGADALTRQADVMEADVEADQEAANPDILTVTKAVTAQANDFIQEIGSRLEEIVTTSMAEFEKARKLRQLIEDIQAVELAPKDEQKEA